MSDPDTSRGEVDFTWLLSSLKRAGCNLLVTGEVGREVTLYASERFFGSVEEERDRLLVQTDLQVERDHSIRSGFMERPRTIDHDPGAVTRTVTTDSPTPNRTPIVDSRLQPLQSRICTEIADLDERAMDLEPAQLRLCFLTLRPIVDSFSYHDSARFLRAVGNTVQGVSGMGYYHLPVPDTDPTVSTFDHLFDARIELRKRTELPTEHRWHVPRLDYSSPWMEL